MTNDDRKPRLPTIGEYVRLEGTLIKIEDVTPPVEQVIDYIFEDTEAQAELRCNGVVLKEIASFNNFYGPNTCIGNAIESATDELQKLGNPTDVYAVVVRVTRRTRRHPCKTSMKNLYDPDYVVMVSSTSLRSSEVVEDIVWDSRVGRIEEPST